MLPVDDIVPQQDGERGYDYEYQMNEGFSSIQEGLSRQNIARAQATRFKKLFGHNATISGQATEESTVVVSHRLNLGRPNGSNDQRHNGAQVAKRPTDGMIGITRVSKFDSQVGFSVQKDQRTVNLLLEPPHRLYGDRIYDEFEPRNVHAEDIPRVIDPEPSARWRTLQLRLEPSLADDISPIGDTMDTLSAPVKHKFWLFQIKALYGEMPPKQLIIFGSVGNGTLKSDTMIPRRSGRVREECCNLAVTTSRHAAASGGTTGKSRGEIEPRSPFRFFTSGGAFGSL
ncbi:hypothetical protein C8R45DRAFT_940270 [Mycena sanguinolenta]|nr:hypothetical protein C8R45DRAFT_940270 [Mycena sanguinolenta]